MSEKTKFEIGEEIVCKINGEKGYISQRYKACVVKFKEGLKVIPESHLEHEKIEYYGERKSPLFIKGDKVHFCVRPPTGKIGEVVISRWFYIVHLFKTGELKVAFCDILAKAGTKIIPVSQLMSAPGRNLPKGLISGLN